MGRWRLRRRRGHCYRGRNHGTSQQDILVRLMLIFVVAIVWVLSAIDFTMSIRRWRGRSDSARKWAGTAALERRVTIASPGLFVCATSLLLMVALETRLSYRGFMILAVGMLIGSTVACVGFLLNRIPRWWGPRWLREMPATERVPDRGNILGALEAYQSSATTVESSPLAALISTESDVWAVRARWVYDSTASRPDTGLGFAGAIAGWLAVSPNEIVFVSTEMESRVRGKQTLFLLDPSHVDAVSRLEPLSRLDGTRQSGVRSPQQRFCPRLVINSGGETYLFEIRQVDKTIGHIQEVASLRP